MSSVATQPIDVVTEALARAGCELRGTSARCPAHDDQHASLSVIETPDGVVLVNCHANAGCDFEKIPDVLGLPRSAFFPSRRTRGDDILATYEYETEPRSRAVRTVPKGFFRQHQLSDGRWVKGDVPEKDRVPYRRGELREAAAAQAEVYVTEGEKDADALWKEGHYATTNSGGAGQWLARYALDFVGVSKVTVVADKDKSGRDHARVVAASLRQVVPEVVIVEALEGKDVTDHLFYGHKVGDLVGVGEDDDAVAPPFTVVPLAQFAATDEGGADPLLGDLDDILIPANGDVMVYGDGGAGKTTLCLDLACHLAAGDEWLGVAVAAPLNVLLIENEGPRPLFRGKAKRKLKGWTGSAFGDRIRVLEEPWAHFTFAEEFHREALAQTVTAHEVAIVIVGPLATSGMNEAGTLQEVRAFIALCDDVRRLAGRSVTFVLIHHENKGGKVSGAWEGAGDTLLHVQGQGTGRTRLHVQKARWSSAWHARSLTLCWTECEGFEVEAKPDISDEDIEDAVLAVIDQDPGTGWRKVKEAIAGVSDARKGASRDRMLADGRIVNVVKENGVEVALSSVPEKRPAHLFRATDPAVRHLGRESAPVPPQSGAAGVTRRSDIWGVGLGLSKPQSHPPQLSGGSPDDSQDSAISAEGGAP